MEWRPVIQAMAAFRWGRKPSRPTRTATLVRRPLASGRFYVTMRRMTARLIQQMGLEQSVVEQLTVHNPRRLLGSRGAGAGSTEHGARSRTSVVPAFRHAPSVWLPAPCSPLLLLLHVSVHSTKQELGCCAAQAAARLLRAAIEQRGRANLIVATGASQFEVLSALTAADGIDWQRVTAFHLDEYLALPVSHPASFRRYLKERFVDRLPRSLAAMHFVDGEADPLAECSRWAKSSPGTRSTWCGGHRRKRPPGVQ